MKINPIEVIWEDAHGSHGWREPQEADYPVIIKSVGYPIKKTAKCIILAEGVHLDQANDDQFLSYIYIPRTQVRKIRRLK